MSQPSAKKNWCGTLYDLDFEETFKTWGPDGEKSLCTYMVWENELCPTTGRKHLQFYMAFKQPYRLTALKKLHPTCKWIACDGTAAENRVYCTKNQRLGIPDTIVVELGNIEDVCGPKHNGGADRGRKDLEDFKDAVKGGMLNMRQLREEHTCVFAKYGAFVRAYVQDHQPTYTVDPHYLNSWQEALNEKLVVEPDDRRIIFVVDPKGNSGKTWFAKYYMSLHPNNTQVMKSAKYLDMAYNLECTSRHVFINCSRQQTEFLNYDFMESIKDGMVFSTKYEPINKKMNKCHVVVLMNQMPDMEKLTQDRYDILNVSDYKDVLPSAERPAKRRRPNLELPLVPVASVDHAGLFPVPCNEPQNGVVGGPGMSADFEPPNGVVGGPGMSCAPTLIYVPPVPEPGPEKPAPDIFYVDSDSDSDTDTDSDTDSDDDDVKSECESEDLCASDGGSITLEDLLADCDSLPAQEVDSYERHLPTRSRLNAILDESDDDSDEDDEAEYEEDQFYAESDGECCIDLTLE